MSMPPVRASPKINDGHDLGVPEILYTAPEPFSASCAPSVRQLRHLLYRGLLPLVNYALVDLAVAQQIGDGNSNMS